jgi:hypothetical protein
MSATFFPNHILQFENVTHIVEGDSALRVYFIISLKWKNVGMFFFESDIFSSVTSPFMHLFLNYCRVK